MGWEDKGIKIDGKWLSSLRFADDVVLISQKALELQQMLEQLITESKKAGLYINL